MLIQGSDAAQRYAETFLGDFVGKYGYNDEELKALTERVERDVAGMFRDLGGMVVEDFQI